MSAYRDRSPVKYSPGPKRNILAKGLTRFNRRWLFIFPPPRKIIVIKKTGNRVVRYLARKTKPGAFVNTIFSILILLCFLSYPIWGSDSFNLRKYI